MFSNFFLENSTVYKALWETMADPDRLRRTMSYVARALHAG